MSLRFARCRALIAATGELDRAFFNVLELGRTELSSTLFLRVLRPGMLSGTFSLVPCVGS